MALHKVRKEEPEEVLAAPTVSNGKGAVRVRQMRERRSKKTREIPRRELAPALLSEFINAINDACRNGLLPYQNFNLEYEGSKNKVHTHYMCDTLDERAFGKVVRLIAKEQNIPLDEAKKSFLDRHVEPDKRGLAFLLTEDGKKFYYDPVEKELLHDYEKKKKLSNAERALIEGLMKKVTGPTQEYLRTMLQN